MIVPAGMLVPDVSIVDMDMDMVVDVDMVVVMVMGFRGAPTRRAHQ
jgi:hypothetical protein